MVFVLDSFFALWFKGFQLIIVLLVVYAWLDLLYSLFLHDRGSVLAYLISLPVVFCMVNIVFIIGCYHYIGTIDNEGRLVSTRFI